MSEKGLATGFAFLEIEHWQQLPETILWPSVRDTTMPIFVMQH